MVLESPSGAFEFFDSEGFHPRTGYALSVVTKPVIEEWKAYLEQRRKDDELKRINERGTALNKRRRTLKRQNVIVERRLSRATPLSAATDLPAIERTQRKRRMLQG